MVEYRTHMKIIGDILTTTRDDLLDDNGANTNVYLIMSDGTKWHYTLLSTAV